jgi:hypothetical protein
VKRPRGGRISLTAFEAEWVWLILDTCGEIAMDTLPFVEIPKPRLVRDDPDEAWEGILTKFARAAP